MSRITDFLARITGKPIEDPPTRPLRRNVEQRVQPETRGKTLTDYVSALASARSYHSPNRSYLVELMHRAMFDPHLASQVALRKQRVLCTPLVAVRADGESAEPITAPWMRDFIDRALDAVLYGYTLISLGREGEDVVVYQVPLLNAYPEQGRIRSGPYDPTGMLYLDEQGQVIPALRSSLVEIGDRWNLGLMPAVIPPALRKLEALGDLGTYLQKEAIPTAVGFTDTNGERAQHLSQALRARRSGGDLVLHMEGGQKMEDVMLVTASSGQGSDKAFRLMIDTCDAEISKLVTGAILATDTSGEGGGNRALGEVHAKQSDMLARADFAMLERVINFDLLPRMRELGVEVPAQTVAFRPEEQVDLKAQAERDLKLSQASGRKLTPEYVERVYGVELAEPEPEPTIVPRDTPTGASGLRSFRIAKVG